MRVSDPALARKKAMTTLGFAFALRPVSMSSTFDFESCLGRMAIRRTRRRHLRKIRRYSLPPAAWAVRGRIRRMWSVRAPILFLVFSVMIGCKGRGNTSKEDPGVPVPSSESQPDANLIPCPANDPLGLNSAKPCRPPAPKPGAPPCPENDPVGLNAPQPCTPLPSKTQGTRPSAK